MLADDETVVALVAEARSRVREVVICALAIIEAVHARTDKARLGRLLSGLRVIPVGDEEAKAASALLMGQGCAVTSAPSTRPLPRPPCGNSVQWSC